MQQRHSTRPQWWEAAVLVLSVYIVGQLALEIVLDLPPATVSALERLDSGICMIFLADWAYYFYRADRKLAYCKRNWLDLVASLPFADAFRVLRVARIVRAAKAIRLIRGLRGMIPILRVITNNKRRSSLVVYGLCTALIYLYCSLGMYHFEKGVNDQFSSFSEALWCAFTTLTSVGYGDVYPITGGGRIMAVALVVTGLGLFSLVTAEIATLFVRFMREDEAQAQAESARANIAANGTLPHERT